MLHYFQRIEETVASCLQPRACAHVLKSVFFWKTQTKPIYNPITQNVLKVGIFFLQKCSHNQEEVSGDVFIFYRINPVL